MHFAPLTRAALVAGFTISAALPVSAQHSDIVDTAVAADDFNTLVAAVQAAGLVETLKGDGPFTVFAPTDAAFAALPDGTVESLLLPENRDQLVSILTYHVVPGRVTAEQVVTLDRATTVQGSDVRISTASGGVRINDSNVITTDIMTSNGIIHVIDAVLLPPEMTSRAGSSSAAREAAEVLGLAIERGVPLFNDGSAESTSAIYEVAARAVLAGDFGLPRRAEQALEDGLRRGGRTHDMVERAWVYRGALDRALDEIEGRMAMRDRH
jgi:uncharacterized surface protein with fasciclin (FAS1) repeats